MDSNVKERNAVGSLEEAHISKVVFYQKDLRLNSACESGVQTDRSAVGARAESAMYFG